MDGLGHLEWLLNMLCEALFPSFTLKHRQQWFSTFSVLGLVDCKSLYDHLVVSSGSTCIQDKRCAVDLVIARECYTRLGGCIRWAPTERQFADCLTKTKVEPADLVRAIMRACQYQISDEPEVLRQATAERERRNARTDEEKARAREYVLKRKGGTAGTTSPSQKGGTSDTTVSELATAAVACDSSPPSSSDSISADAHVCSVVSKPLSRLRTSYYPACTSHGEICCSWSGSRGSLFSRVLG